MKEYSNYMTKSQAEYEKWKDYLVDKQGEFYNCSLCKKNWIPTVDDVNRKRPSTYYKLCSACRGRALLKSKEYKMKHGNNYDKNRDA